MKIRLILLAGAALPLFVSAQHPWTLSECCDYAVAHNISIKQQENQCRQQELQLSTARNQRLPDLSGSIGQNFSFGRGLTSENTYTNTNTSSTSFSLGTSVPLFTGFQIPNNIRLNQLNLEAATAELEKARNDIRMQVAQQYVQILYDTEICEVARRQIAIDSAQVTRLEAFVSNGKASEAELSQAMATLAQSRLTATQADNNRRLSLLTLSQTLELPTAEGFDIVKPKISESAGATEVAFSDGSLSLAQVLPSPEAIYAEALGIKPEIAAQQLRLRGTDYNISIARAGYYPTLSLSAGLGTNYYKTSGYPSAGFGKQMENNFSQYIGLNLSVPIFNRFQTRNNIRSAKIEQQTQQLQLDLTKKTLYKEIQQVWLNAQNALEKEHSSAVALRSSQDAFRLTQAKYENGKATITEFNEQKNSYLKAESDLVQARYERLYQQTLLDFYRGQQMVF